jgi:hypothetical protein
MFPIDPAGRDAGDGVKTGSVKPAGFDDAVVSMVVDQVLD